MRVDHPSIFSPFPIPVPGESPRVRVLLGSHLGWPSPRGGSSTAVEQVVVHERFVSAPDGAPGHSNLALLRVAEPMRLSRAWAWPICLPPPTATSVERKLEEAPEGTGFNELDCNFEAKAATVKPENHVDMTNCAVKESVATGFEGDHISTLWKTCVPPVASTINSSRHPAQVLLRSPPATSRAAPTTLARWSSRGACPGATPGKGRRRRRSTSAAPSCSPRRAPRGCPGSWPSTPGG